MVNLEERLISEEVVINDLIHSEAYGVTQVIDQDTDLKQRYISLIPSLIEQVNPKAFDEKVKDMSIQDYLGTAEGIYMTMDMFAAGKYKLIFDDNVKDKALDTLRKVSAPLRRYVSEFTQRAQGITDNDQLLGIQKEVMTEVFAEQSYQEVWNKTHEEYMAIIPQRATEWAQLYNAAVQKALIPKE